MYLYDVMCPSVGRVVHLEMCDQPVGSWVRHYVVSSGGLFGSGGSACVIIVRLVPLLSLCSQIDQSSIFELFAKTREGGSTAVEVAHH